MKIKLLAALAALGMSGNALAVVCTPKDPKGFQTETLSAESGVIKLRADAAVSTGTNDYIGRANSPSLSTVVIYNCPGEIVHGSRPLDAALVPYDNYNNMYRTNIEGIGVRFVATPPNGDEGAVLPMLPYFAGGESGASSTDIRANQGRFVAYFYKLSNDIKLSKPNMSDNLLYTKKNIGYNKIEDTTVSIYAIENIYIVGVPVCTIDKPLPVDFNTVNASDVRSGVDRSFEFGINCKTDYGNYDVVASIRADNRTDDDNYIKVTDNNSKDDALVIEITDGNNNRIKVNGKEELRASNISSGQKAAFRWHAKLKKPNGQPYPAQGPFHAEAVITLNIK